MIDCLILGDSIAVGLQQFKPECQAQAKGGVNSWQFNRQYTGPFGARSVVISLGSNDHVGVKTRRELETLRSKVTEQSRVFWILPANQKLIQDIIILIAQANGDIVVPIARLQKDQIHPSWAGYRDLSEKINLHE